MKVHRISTYAHNVDSMLGLVRGRYCTCMCWTEGPGCRRPGHWRDGRCFRRRTRRGGRRCGDGRRRGCRRDRRCFRRRTQSPGLLLHHRQRLVPLSVENGACSRIGGRSCGDGRRRGCRRDRRCFRRRTQRGGRRDKRCFQRSVRRGPAHVCEGCRGPGKVRRGEEGPCGSGRRDGTGRRRACRRGEQVLRGGCRGGGTGFRRECPRREDVLRGGCRRDGTGLRRGRSYRRGHESFHAGGGVGPCLVRRRST